MTQAEDHYAQITKEIEKLEKRRARLQKKLRKQYMGKPAEVKDMDSTIGHITNVVFAKDNIIFTVLLPNNISVFRRKSEVNILRHLVEREK